MKPPIRQVIITGDDFGLSAAVNRAIVRANREGILSCASLMINGPAWQEAVDLAKAHPKLCLGLHLTLIQGQGVLPPCQIPHLVDAQGTFRHNPVGAGLTYFFSRRAQAEIAAELTAQVEKMLGAGLQPRFLNGHLNIHLHPAVWPLVRRLAAAYGIPGVRLARENLGVTLSLNRQRPASKTAHALIFAWLSRRAAKSLGTLKTNDYLFGLLNDGAMDESFLLGLLPRLAPGVTEIYCHPAELQNKPFMFQGNTQKHEKVAKQELRNESEVPKRELGNQAFSEQVPLWPAHYRPQDELQALLSPKVAEVLEARNLELISFDDL